MGLQKSGYTDEELLQMICDKAEELGRAPMKKEVAMCGIIKQRFGTWRRCVERAGLEPYRRYKKGDHPGGENG